MLSASQPSEEIQRPLRLWDVQEAARETGLTPRQVRSIIGQRLVPTVKIGRLVRLRPDDLRAYIEANTRPANSL